MKTLLLTLSLLLVLTFSSTAQTQEEVDEAMKFYPLEIGNVWEFKSNQFDWMHGDFITHFRISIVADTLMPNGHTYFVFHKQSIPDTLAAIQWYERMDPTNAKTFRYLESGDFINDFFPMVLADWSILDKNEQVNSETYPKEVLLDNLPFFNTGGNYACFRFPDYSFESLCKVSLSSLLVSDPFEPDVFVETESFPPAEYGFTKDIGLVRFRVEEGGSGTETTLQYALIDGQEFGQPIVNAPRESEIPGGVVLHANYPNPFNPSTNIVFELREPSHVQMSVFNMKGQLIQVLLNENLNQGTHTVQFHAEGLSSGMYLYRLQTGDVVQTKKMLLVK